MGTSKSPNIVFASVAKQSITRCFVEALLDCHVASLLAKTVFRSSPMFFLCVLCDLCS